MLELNSSSLTLQTTTYRTWEELFVVIKQCMDALVETYKPSFFERVGLRYIDVIDKRKLGLNGAPWSELLNLAIVGELAEGFIEANVEAIQKSVRVRNHDRKGGFLLQHGIPLEPLESGPTASTYFIDFDFYVDQKTEIGDARTTLEHLHSRVGRAWSWCITPKLHAALEPQPIPTP
jgi:uncharacterized protein (TIGR04255 family)